MGLAAFVLLALQFRPLFRLAGDPTQSDFANYYVPAHVLRSGGDLGALYEQDWFDAAARHARVDRLGSFIPHPPANALWLLPFASMNPADAKRAWTLTLTIALLATGFVLRALAPEMAPEFVALVLLLPALSIRNSLSFGQPYPALLLFVAAGALALAQSRDFTGGFARTSVQQNLVLRWVRDEALYDLWLRLNELELGTAVSL